jgi:hypothetical protein
MTDWLDENCDIGDCSITPAGTSGGLNDAIAVYMNGPTCAVAFVARCACSAIRRVSTSCARTTRRAGVDCWTQLTSLVGLDAIFVSVRTRTRPLKATSPPAWVKAHLAALVIQNALEHGDASLVYFVFDLLFLDGEDLTSLPLVNRKTRLEAFLVGAPDNVKYSDHQIGQGPAFHKLACEHGLEGIVSKHVDGRYEPDRRSWLKVKCLNREEFVVVGWSDPEGSRHRIGALLLGYYTPGGELLYAGRVGTGMTVAEPICASPTACDPEMPLSEPPPRGSRFGSLLVLSRLHWAWRRRCDL